MLKRRKPLLGQSCPDHRKKHTYFNQHFFDLMEEKLSE